MLRIAVSILNYNAATATLDCVHSLQSAVAEPEHPFQLWLWVADNASADSDANRLESELAGQESVRFHRHARNLGFAAGHNRNLRRIFAGRQPDFVWLLNNDCRVDKTCVSELLKCSRAQPAVGIWGATLLEADGHTVQCAGGCDYNRWLSSYRPRAKGRELDRLGKVADRAFDYVAGASLFMPARVLTGGLLPARGVTPFHPDDGPWLNETFFLYFEELDLAARLKPDWRMGWCRGAHIVHAPVSKPDRGRQASNEFHATLSALQFTHLHHPALLWLTASGRLLIKFVWRLAGLKWHLIRPNLAALSAYRAWRRNHSQKTDGVL